MDTIEDIFPSGYGRHTHGSITDCDRDIQQNSHLSYRYRHMCHPVDLVSYSSPRLIDSVTDAIDSNIKVLFPVAESRFHSMKNTPKDSDAHKIVDHAINQSKVGNTSSQLVADNLRELSQKVRKRSIIAILSGLAIETAQIIDCLDANNQNFYHISKDSIFTEHDTIFFSRNCDAEIRRRVSRVHKKVFEFGLFVKIYQDAPSIIIDIYLRGLKPDIYCVHRHKQKNIISSNNNEYQIKLSHIDGLLIILITRYFIISLLVLIFERIFSNQIKMRYQMKMTKRHYKPRIDQDNHRCVLERSRNVDKYLPARLHV